MQKKIKNRIDAILFDLDGTFVDTSKDMCHVLNVILMENNLEEVNSEDLKYHISKGATGIIEFGCKNNVDKIKKNQLKEKFLNLYESHVCVHSHLIEGMSEVIENFEINKIAWGIVTNKHARFANTILDKLGYLKKLDCLITGDMVQQSKPSPDSLILAKTKLNKDFQNIIYVGDDRRDILAGKEAGMITVAADFGFVFNKSIIPSWEADYIINEPSQLLEIINH